MTDPERLKSGDADAFERSLLLAARSDAGSERALRKALSVFALGATVGLSGAAAAGGTQPAAVSGIVIAKWFGLGALAGILSATGVHTVQRELQSRDLKTTPNAAYAPKSSAQAGLREAPGTDTPIAADHALDPAVTAHRHVHEAPAAIRNAGPPSASPSEVPLDQNVTAASLREQVRLLEHARAELSARRTRMSLAALDEYERRFPKGPLAPEAAVLHIEAFLLDGQRAAAERMGAAFLRAHPAGPHAQRVRSLLERAGGRSQ
jgi:hypothetical protein